MSRCTKCNSLVTDSIELQIEQHGKVKLGRHDTQGWICHDCSDSGNSQNNLAMNDSNHQKQETIEPVKSSDVSCRSGYLLNCTEAANIEVPILRCLVLMLRH